MKMTLIFSFIFFTFYGVLLFFTSCDYQPYKQGRNLYNFYCATCHIDDGTGLKGLYPPLAQSDYLANHQDQLACIIRYGLKDTIIVNGKTYDQAMIPVTALNEVQITNVINYINHSWGNTLPHVKVVEIKEALKDCGKTK